MSRARPWFYGLATAQALFLLGWAGWHEAALRTYPTILLETRPVDPSEIIRGDFVILNYVISTVEHSRFDPPLTFDPGRYGETVCVELAQQGEFHVISRAAMGSCARDEPASGGHRIEGVVGGLTQEHLRVDYGIDRYYVPEGKGQPSGKVTALVAVSPRHQALLKELYLDGQVYP